VSQIRKKRERPVQGLTLHTQRWRHGRTVVSRGADMQITHLKARMRLDVERKPLAGLRMQQREYSLRGLQHVTAIYFFEFKRLATRCGAISGRILQKSSHMHKKTWSENGS
jgi:hypothetical protein